MLTQEEQGASIRLLYVAEETTDESEDADEFLDALEGVSDFTVRSVIETEEGTNHLDEGFDCLVTHHGEQVDGITFLERVRERYPNLPCILIGPDDGMVASRALKANVSGYVPRTSEEATRVLLERVRSAVTETMHGEDEKSPRLPIDELGVGERLELKERAMEEAPIGITISDPTQPDNPLIYLNAAFEELTGYSKEEVVGRNCRFLQGENSDPETVKTMREAIDDEKPVSVELLNYRKDGESFWNKVDIAPIRNEAGETTNYVGFQTDVTARKEAEFELERERDRLEQLLARISGLLQDVHDDLIQARNREEVEYAICEHIATTDTYDFCWVGDPDLAQDSLVANIWAGVWEPDAGELDVDLDGESTGLSPVVEAYETGEIQLVADSDALATIVNESPWIEDGTLEGIAAIPLVYQETCYGVLSVYTTQETALSDHDVVVLEALGKGAATAINALERGRILVADTIIELEFEIQDTDMFFADLSARGSVADYHGSIHRGDGTLHIFFTADADSAVVEDVTDTHPDVEDLALVNEQDETNLFKVRVSDGSISTALAERGARIRSMRGNEGVGYVTVELPIEADPRAIVELLQDRYTNVALVSYQEQERPPTRREFIEELKETLTERQLTALQTAYASGFYEWNRPVTGNELAESMGITRPTFHQHLRAAERKLIGELLDT